MTVPSAQADAAPALPFQVAARRVVAAALRARAEAAVEGVAVGVASELLRIEGAATAPSTREKGFGDSLLDLEESEDRASVIVERAKADADPATTAELARRIKESELQMNAALQAADNAGKPLDHATRNAPDSLARKFWQAGMNTYWGPGSAARLKVADLQGEARIVKAQEAAALLCKAKAVFQEGMRVTE